MSPKLVRMGKRIAANVAFNAMVFAALNFTLLMPVAQAEIRYCEKKCAKKNTDIVFAAIWCICNWPDPRRPPEDPCPPETNQDASSQCCDPAGGGAGAGPNSLGAVAAGIGGAGGNNPYVGVPFAQVNVTDGRLHHVTVDLSMTPKSSVLGPFQVKRQYISNTEREGHFGVGWYWGFDSTAENVDGQDTTIKWVDPKGDVAEFALVGQSQEQEDAGCFREYQSDAWSLDWVRVDPDLDPDLDSVEVGTFGGRKYTYNCSPTVGPLLSITTFQPYHRVLSDGGAIAFNHDVSAIS